MRDSFIRALYNPKQALRYSMLGLKGLYYKARYKLLNSNVSIGRKLKVRCRLSIKGPGKVIIGDNVVVDGTTHTVTPWTSNKNASLIIGDNVFLNGTRFGCNKQIVIGNDCILADCRIMDTDFDSINPEKRNDPEYIKSEPITIGNNVWIAMDSVVLKGVTIGDNSTVAARSVVYSDIPSNVVYGENPAVLIKNT